MNPSLLGDAPLPSEGYYVASGGRCRGRATCCCSATDREKESVRERERESERERGNSSLKRKRLSGRVSVPMAPEFAVLNAAGTCSWRWWTQAVRTTSFNNESLRVSLTKESLFLSGGNIIFDSARRLPSDEEASFSSARAEKICLTETRLFGLQRSQCLV